MENILKTKEIETILNNAYDQKGLKLFYLTYPHETNISEETKNKIKKELLNGEANFGVTNNRSTLINHSFNSNELMYAVSCAVVNCVCNLKEYNENRKLKSLLGNTATIDEFNKTSIKVLDGMEYVKLELSDLSIFAEYSKCELLVLLINPYGVTYKNHDSVIQDLIKARNIKNVYTLIFFDGTPKESKESGFSNIVFNEINLTKIATEKVKSNVANKAIGEDSLI